MLRIKIFIWCDKCRSFPPKITPLCDIYYYVQCALFNSDTILIHNCFPKQFL